jgi:hypothetical protein
MLGGAKTVLHRLPKSVLPTFLPRNLMSIESRLTSASTLQTLQQTQAMADTAEPVPTPDALVVAEADPTNAPNEEQQLESTKKVKKIIRRKKRPARVQADPSVAKADPSTQSGLQWNIWYSKHEGGQRGDEQHSLNKPAPGRCSIARDAGYTRADRTPGAFFCGKFCFRGSICLLCLLGADMVLLVHFARGVCHKGADCEYLHRLPGIHDLYQPNTDCFGR